MENEVLKIIINHSTFRTGEMIGGSQFKSTAREITEMMTEFIEWFTGKDSPMAILYGNQKKRFATTKKDYTIEELFQYWFTNVRGK